MWEWLTGSSCPPEAWSPERQISEYNIASAVTSHTQRKTSQSRWYWYWTLKGKSLMDRVGRVMVAFLTKSTGPARMRVWGLAGEEWVEVRGSAWGAEEVKGPDSHFCGGPSKRLKTFEWGKCRPNYRSELLQLVTKLLTILSVSVQISSIHTSFCSGGLPWVLPPAPPGLSSVIHGQDCHIAII